MQPTSHAGRPGFTLMEVLVAMSVLTIAIAGAAFMLTSAYGAYRHQDRTMATDQLVHDQLETLTSTSYETLRTAIRQARRPDTTPQDTPAPGQDWVMSGAPGDATTEYELLPPRESGQDWEPRVIPRTPSGTVLQVSQPQGPAPLKATLRLQYWDPTFDAPAPSDRGLIRATFAITGDGVNKHGVKYLARNVQEGAL
jgi:prepilin-type N-terminal cleavage/methylation domain-containing protein